MDDVFAKAREWSATPVDVRRSPIDSDLGDHLWMRLGTRVGEDPDAVAALSDDLRAFYVTRLFGQEYGSGGVTGFLDWGAALAPFVSAGYRYLGLFDAALAFTTLWAHPVILEMSRDEAYIPTQEDADAIARLAAAIGEHEEERIAFVRRHPDAFSVWRTCAM